MLAGLEVGVREHDGELLAAEARGQVDRPRLVDEDPAHEAQDVVADDVAERVVDVLEVVEVADDDGERAAGAPRARRARARAPR